MKVININRDIEDRRKQDMLDVLEEMREQIEQGVIKEFVACSLSDEGYPQIHVAAVDLPGSIGLFEIGKNILINQTV